MTHRTVRIGITGSHSTGKSTFLKSLRSELGAHSVKVGGVSDLAIRAQSKGFAILDGHTFDSTLWIMGQCLADEAAASLTADVVLIDRPVLDALGYLRAALEVTSRSLDPSLHARLAALATADTAHYDVLIVTMIDPAIPLGAGRDANKEFRASAARHIDRIVAELSPNATRLTPSNAEAVLQHTVTTVMELLNKNSRR